MMLDFFRYHLPLTAPLNLAGTALTHREGLLLRLKNAAGTCGWGDVAPLPSFSRESLDDAAQSIDSLQDQAGDLPLHGSVTDPDGALAAWLDARALPPSVRFGIELAVANLVAAEHETTLPHVLSAAPHATVPVNALLTSEVNELADEAARLREASYRAVKLKVGRRSVADDVRRVRVASAALGPDVALRLDANRAWTWDDAIVFADAVKDVRVEYLEEPLARPDELGRFTEHCPQLPVALDETTREWTPGATAGLKNIAAFVLKPTLLGGIAATSRWAHAARQHGARIVLSTSYESGLGLLALVALAATFGDDTTAHGLGAYTRLADDVLDPRPTWGDGRIDVPAVFAPPNHPVVGRLTRC